MAPTLTVMLLPLRFVLLPHPVALMKMVSVVAEMVPWQLFELLAVSFQKKVDGILRHKENTRAVLVILWSKPPRTELYELGVPA